MLSISNPSWSEVSTIEAEYFPEISSVEDFSLFLHMKFQMVILNL